MFNIKASNTTSLRAKIWSCGVNILKIVFYPYSNDFSRLGASSQALGIEFPSGHVLGIYLLHDLVLQDLGWPQLEQKRGRICYRLQIDRFVKLQKFDKYFEHKLSYIFFLGGRGGPPGGGPRRRFGGFHGGQGGASAPPMAGGGGGWG